MRVAFVSTEVAGFHGGGIGTYVVEAAHALGEAGHEVWLITRAPDAESDRERLRRHDDFERVVFVEELEVPDARVRFALGRHALWFSQLAFEALRDAADRLDVEFDYVEFPDYEAAGYVTLLEHELFGTFENTVFSVVLHSPTHECWEYNEMQHAMPPHVREICVLEHEAIRAAPMRQAPSKRLREMIEARLTLPSRPHEAEPVGIVRYPMRVDPRVDAAADDPPRPGRKMRDLSFLYFGRIEPRKGVRALVAAFRRLPELRIECIGRDNASAPLGTSEIEYLSRRGPSNVVFRGEMPRDRVLEKLREADVVVLPSTWENWPNTCIEAMAAGRVVIGGRNGGMGEMIEHGVSGFLCDGSDPADIRRVISEDLAGALDRLDEIGRAASARIRELSAPTTYVRSIERLVETGRVRLAEARSSRDRERAPRGSGARRQELVSIVVPFYREPFDLIREAVDSALAQTWQNLEILVVDDGSPRADADHILDRLAERDDRVRVARKSNGGLASARNFAIEEMRGDYVLFLDADNRLRPEYVEDGVTVFRRHADVAAVVPCFDKFDDRTGKTIVVVAPLPFDRPLAVFRNSFGDAGAMFRASVFRDHGLRYDPVVDAYSDWALWMDCARVGLRVQTVPRVLYDYRVREGSMMDEQAWHRHLHLLGLLVHRHLPPADGRDEPELLTTLIQGWGLGALLSALDGSPKYSERPYEAAEGYRPGHVRYRFADALAKFADKIPGAKAVLRPLARTALRWHARSKDRRRGARPVR